MPLWTTANLPDLTGRSVIITGANSGLGFETAKALAHKGASLTLAVRDRSKGDHAAAAIGGDITTEILDLADLDAGWRRHQADDAADGHRGFLPGFHGEVVLELDHSRHAELSGGGDAPADARSFTPGRRTVSSRSGRRKRRSARSTK